ncbi:hypothetical protein D9M70_466390 [compost metagenome]
MEVMNRPPPLPDFERCCGNKRLMQIGLGSDNRVLKRLPTGKTGGNCGRQRAASTMIVPRLDPGSRQAQGGIPVEEDIDSFVALGMPAFHQHGARTKFQQHLRLERHLRLALGSAAPRHQCRFGQVRRHDEAKRQ